MNTTNPQTTKNIFEEIKRIDVNNNEYWFARELMPLLQYDKWDNFQKVIEKAITSFKASSPHISDHFADVGKLIKVGSGTNKEAIRQIKDYKLTRYACYLIAQNGDSTKKAIALAQNYFTTQTRKQELVESKEKDIERILARKKLSESEKKFGGIMSKRGVDGRGIAEIKSSGDNALFGTPTKQVKQKLGIKEDKPLADYLPTISIKAKDLATEMTSYKTQINNLHDKDTIKKEHVDNNSAVRKMLTGSGIYPENLPVEEDIKRLEKKYSLEEILSIDNTKLLSINILEIDLTGVQDKDELEKIKYLIEDNQGNSKLKIYYGTRSNIKILEREIQINSEIINGLKKYLVITS